MPNASTPTSPGLPRGVAFAVIALIVVGAGYFVWSSMSNSMPDMSRLRPDRSGTDARGGFGDFFNPPRQPQPDGITASPGRVYTVRAGPQRITVFWAGDRFAVRTRNNFANINRADRALLSRVDLILSRDTVRDQLKVTPEQLAALQNLPPMPGEIDPASASQLIELITQYEKAINTPAAEDIARQAVALAGSIEQIDPNTASAMIRDRITRVREILTAEQLSGGNNRGPANPQPAN